MQKTKQRNSIIYILYRSHALRGNADPDALRPPYRGSGKYAVPTQSVGTMAVSFTMGQCQLMREPPGSFSRLNNASAPAYRHSRV
jgi:hypothetical protein